VLYWCEATEGPCGIAWIRGARGDPLLPGHPLGRRGHTSAPLFGKAGLGLPYEYNLATSGIADVDDIRGAAVEGTALLDFVALLRRWTLLEDSVSARASLRRVHEAIGKAVLPPIQHWGPFLSPVDVDSRQQRLEAVDGVMSLAGRHPSPSSSGDAKPPLSLRVVRRSRLREARRGTTLEHR
jgi:hypothetical protein